MTGLCYADRLIQQTRNTWHLVGRVLAELFLLISIPAAAVLLPMYFPDLWSPPSELTIVGILKIVSISLLGFHTVIFTPLRQYRWNAIVMAGAVALIFGYVATSGNDCANSKLIYCWSSYRYAGEIVTSLSFGYMFVFLVQNISVLRRDRAKLEVKLFVEAFIFGVNVPAILAFFCVLAMYEFVLYNRSEIFLSGATALLVFVSSASSVCIDHYAQAFILASPTNCPRT